jgi:hypothetical protein
MAAGDPGLSLRGNYLQRLPASASLEQVSNVLNEVIDALNQQLQTQIYSDGTNKRMLIGYQKDGWGTGQDFGLKVSLPNVDVASASDNQLLFKMALDKWTWRNGNGALIKEFDIANGVEKYYDATSGKNYMQAGTLPDNTGGWAIADIGYNVSDGF